MKIQTKQIMEYLFLAAMLTVPVGAQDAAAPPHRSLNPPLRNWDVPRHWLPSSTEMDHANGLRALTTGSDPSVPLTFVAITPCRIADTRAGQGFTGQFGPPALTASTPRDFPLPQSTNCSIPATAAAYSLNLTAVPQGILGWLEVYPTGGKPQKPVSTLNSLNGQVIANAAIVPAGTSGGIEVEVANATDLVIDINGYFTSSTGGRTSVAFVESNGALGTGAPGVHSSRTGTGQYTITFPAGTFVPGVVTVPVATPYNSSATTVSSVTATVNSDGSGSVTLTFSQDTSFGVAVIQNTM